MGISLDIDAKHRYGSREEFMSATPPYSAAIDGVVAQAGIEVIHDLNGAPYLIIDHHSGNRASVLATCEQSFEGLAKHAFDEDFKIDGELSVGLIAEHLDEDVLTTYGLFKHEREIFSTLASRTRVARFVDAEGKADRHLGFYPIQEDIWGVMLKIFEQYYTYRYGEGLHDLSKDDLLYLAEDVDARFHAYVQGDARMIEPWGEYEVLERGAGWRIVKETGPAARSKMLQDSLPFEEGGQNIPLFVILKGVRKNGMHDYTVASPSLRLALNSLEKFLNDAEGDLIQPGKNQWGGNINCKGSPRTTGSALSVSELATKLDEYTGEDRTRFYLQLI